MKNKTTFKMIRVHKANHLSDGLLYAEVRTKDKKRDTVLTYHGLKLSTHILTDESKKGFVMYKHETGLLGTYDKKKKRLFIEGEKFARKCDECKNGFNEGYVIDGGAEYYCSPKCLHTHYTKEEWLKMYAEGNSETMYTEWEMPTDAQYIVKGGKLVETEEQIKTVSIAMTFRASMSIAAMSLENGNAKGKKIAREMLGEYADMLDKAQEKEKALKNIRQLLEENTSVRPLSFIERAIMLEAGGKVKPIKKEKGAYYLITIEERNGDKEYTFKRPVFMPTNNARRLQQRINKICSTWYDDDYVEVTAHGYSFSDGICVEFMSKKEITKEEFEVLQKFNI